eukprot:5279533-Pleurochrysis_carterae.AAC.5
MRAAGFSIVLRIHSMSWRSTEAISSGDTMNRARSSAVNTRGGLDGSCGAGVIVVPADAPERVPPAGPAPLPSMELAFAEGN